MSSVFGFVAFVAIHTLLDLVFVAATSSRRRDNFAETYKILRITREYTPRVVFVLLGLIGQDLL